MEGMVGHRLEDTEAWAVVWAAVWAAVAWEVEGVWAAVAWVEVVLVAVEWVVRWAAVVAWAREEEVEEATMVKTG